MPQPPDDASVKLLGQLVEAINRDIQPLLPAAQYPARRNLLDTSEMFSDDFLYGLGREKYWMKYGYVLLSAECLQAVATLLRGKTVLDVGSGGGFLSHALAVEGVRTVALDERPPGLAPSEIDVRTLWKVDIVDDVRNHDVTAYEVVLLSWPEHGSTLAFEVACAMRPGQLLVYQGEWFGATAEAKFFGYVRGDCWAELDAETAALNRHHVQFRGLHDRWHVYRKLA